MPRPNSNRWGDAIPLGLGPIGSRAIAGPLALFDASEAQQPKWLMTLDEQASPRTRKQQQLVNDVINHLLRTGDLTGGISTAARLGYRPADATDWPPTADYTWVLAEALDALAKRTEPTNVSADLAGGAVLADVITAVNLILAYLRAERG